MKIKICKGPKFKSQPYSFGVTNPNWDINEGRYVVSFNNLNKIMQIIEDGEIFDKEGKPVLALDVATEILKQNRFNDSSIGSEVRYVKIITVHISYLIIPLNLKNFSKKTDYQSQRMD